MTQIQTLDSKTLDQVRKDLVSWFHENARVLPWRKSLTQSNELREDIQNWEKPQKSNAAKSTKKTTKKSIKQKSTTQLNGLSLALNEDLRNPYKTWISEIMLQQTQVITVIDYFNRWMNKFPTIEVLASSDESQVLESWAGLGYYSRARNIHKTAKFLVENYEGKLPRTREELLSLSGIGEYTAGAILSLAMGQPEAILDGNCIRVLSRLHRVNFFPVKQAELREYWSLAQDWSDHPEPQSVNEAIMELGASICKPQQAECHLCPLEANCPSSNEDTWKQFPPPKPKKKWKEISLVTLVVEVKGKILMVNNSELSFLAKNSTFPALTWSEDLSKLSQKLETFDCQFDLGAQVIKHTITQHKLELQVIHLELNSQKKWLEIAHGLMLQIQSETWYSPSDLPLITKLSQKIWEVNSTM